MPDDHDTRQVKSLFNSIAIERATRGEKPILRDGPTITHGSHKTPGLPANQAPGYSPTRPGRNRQNKYTKIQLDQAVELSRKVGSAEACRLMGIPKSTLYWHARAGKSIVGKEGKPRKSRMDEKREKKLDHLVKLALFWYNNTPTRPYTIRENCKRAGNTVTPPIPGNTIYAHYTLHAQEFKNGQR